MVQNKIGTIFCTLVLLNGLILPMGVNADSTKVVTIGADLTDTQRETVLSFFNVDENEVLVIEVSNQEERMYLEGIVNDSIIGTHTLSCCYINPTEDGGIQVKTANLTWVTENMLANALLTAGINNCQVIATAPFEVSGTGALTGILKAYETASEVELDEEKKQQATEELVISAELTEENNEDKVLEMINDLKEQAVNGELSDNLTSIINAVAEEYGVTVSDEAMSKLIDWLEKFEQLTYDVDQFSRAIDSLNNSIKGLSETVTEAKTETKGFFARIFEAIKNFFAMLFGKGKQVTEEVKDTIPSIFDEVNTDIFEFDTQIGDSQGE